MRNDYILDLNKIGKKTILSQIEYNTISCASGAATSRMTNLHRLFDNFLKISSHYNILYLIFLKIIILVTFFVSLKKKSLLKKFVQVLF